MFSNELSFSQWPHLTHLADIQLLQGNSTSGSGVFVERTISKHISWYPTNDPTRLFTCTNLCPVEISHQRPHFPFHQLKVQSAIQKPISFFWVYKAEAVLTNFCPNTCFDHILVGGQCLILYVCICFCQCATYTCAEVGSGSYVVELFVLGAYGRRGKRIHQNLFTRRGTLRSKRQRQIQFFSSLFFLKEKYPLWNTLGCHTVLIYINSPNRWITPLHTWV